MDVTLLHLFFSLQQKDFVRADRMTEKYFPIKN